MNTFHSSDSNQMFTNPEHCSYTLDSLCCIITLWNTFIPKYCIIASFLEQVSTNLVQMVHQLFCTNCP